MPESRHDGLTHIAWAIVVFAGAVVFGLCQMTPRSSGPEIVGVALMGLGLWRLLRSPGPTPTPSAKQES